MTDRIIEISTAPAVLRSRNQLLVIEVDGEERDRIPFAEIAAVVVTHRQAVFTQGAVTGLAEAGASLVTCDEKYLPAAMLLPLTGHHAQAERFAKQAALTLPKKKRWWQAIVRAKIQAQANVLRQLHGTDYGVAAMASRVGSGDAANVEAQAARRYWNVLFGDSEFRRGNDDDARNALLNYGYAILRGTVVRALCGCGLHPTFGLHHHNKFNAFALGDDLMEPYRPAVDMVVVRLSRERCELDAVVKRELIAEITGRYVVEGERRTLFDMVTRTAQGLANAMLGGDLGWKPARWDFAS